MRAATWSWFQPRSSAPWQLRRRLMLSDLRTCSTMLVFVGLAGWLLRSKRMEQGSGREEGWLRGRERGSGRDRIYNHHQQQQKQQSGERERENGIGGHTLSGRRKRGSSCPCRRERRDSSRGRARGGSCGASATKRRRTTSAAMGREP